MRKYTFNFLSNNERPKEIIIQKEPSSVISVVFSSLSVGWLVGLSIDVTGTWTADVIRCNAVMIYYYALFCGNLRCDIVIPMWFYDTSSTTKMMMMMFKHWSMAEMKRTETFKVHWLSKGGRILSVTKFCCWFLILAAFSAWFLRRYFHSRSYFDIDRSSCDEWLPCDQCNSYAHKQDLDHCVTFSKWKEKENDIVGRNLPKW